MLNQVLIVTSNKGGRELPEVLTTMSGLQEQVYVQKDSASRVTRLGFMLVLSTTNYA